MITDNVELLKGDNMPKLASSLNMSGNLYIHMYRDIPKNIPDSKKAASTTKSSRKELADEMKAPVNDGDSGLLGKFRSLFK